MDYSDPAVWLELDTLLRHVTPAPTGAFGRYECEPGWTWHPRLHDYDLWFVLSGAGRASLNGAPALALGAGTLLLLRPGDRGSFTQDPHNRLTVLSCHLQFIDRRNGEVRVLDSHLTPSRSLVVRPVGVVAELMVRVIRMLRDPGPLRTLAASGALMELTTEVYRADAHAHGVRLGLDTRLHDAIEIIAERPSHRYLLDEVARAVGLSAPQLSRLFVQQLGTTFRRFVVDVRLDRAQVLLRDSAMSVSQVALVLGYSDQFLFSRQFRERFGEPPSAYRRSVHNADAS